MTSFSSIFKELTKNGARLIRHLVSLQIIAGILFGFWAPFYPTFGGESRTYFLISFITITPPFDVAYLFLSSRKNEQVCASQTRRLAPIRESTLLPTNLLSTIVDGSYLVTIQLAMILITGLPVTGTNEFWKTTFKNFGSIDEGKLWQSVHITGLISVIILLTLVGIFVYLVVSLISFTGKIVSDFLSEKIDRLVYFLVVVSLTCIGLIFLANVYWFIMDSATGFLRNGVLLTALGKGAIDIGSDPASNYLTMAVILAVDITLISINVMLLRKYHEAKI